MTTHLEPIDEICRCGLLKSHHHDLRIGNRIIEKGHGAGPGCDRFVWIDFVFSEADPRYQSALSLFARRISHMIGTRVPRPAEAAPALPWYQELMPGVYQRLHTVTVGEVVITPTSAARVLQERNRPEGNRNIIASQLELLSRSITAGDFIITGETIIFDVNGNLINGQHRLTACVETDRPIPALVVIGVQSSAFSVLDQHSKRTFGQVLQMMNRTNCNALGGSVTVLHAFLQTGHLYRLSRSAITMGESLRLLASHPRLEDSVSFLVGHSKGLRLFASNTIPVVAHYVFRHVNVEEADDFFSSFVDYKIPDGARWQAPHLLLKRLSSAALERKHKLLPRAISSLLIKAWNCYHENRPCGTLKYNDEEDYPTVSGLHYTRQGRPILNHAEVGAGNGQLP